MLTAETIVARAIELDNMTIVARAMERIISAGHLAEIASTLNPKSP